MYSELLKSIFSPQFFDHLLIHFLRDAVHLVHRKKPVSIFYKWCCMQSPEVHFEVSPSLCAWRGWSRPLAMVTSRSVTNFNLRGWVAGSDVNTVCERTQQHCICERRSCCDLFWLLLWVLWCLRVGRGTLWKTSLSSLLVSTFHPVPASATVFLYHATWPTQQWPLSTWTFPWHVWYGNTSQHT